MAFYNESLSGEPGVKLQGGGGGGTQVPYGYPLPNGRAEHQNIYSPLKDQKGGQSTSK